MIVAKYVAEFIRSKGIDKVFGYDGSMMLKLADEISLTDGLEYLQTFNEQGASFAADAYGRLSGTPKIVLVTSGPGVINGLCGVVDAYMDSIPLILIAGNDRYSNMKDNPGVRLTGFQDMDVVSITKPITKYSVQIRNANDIIEELEKAYAIAMEGRKGPVVVDIPMDIQFMEIDDEKLKCDDKSIYCKKLSDSLDVKQPQNDKISSDVVLDVIDKINKSRRPVILAGGGVRLSGAESFLREFAEYSNVPVVTTLNGYDSYEKSIGFSGLYGMPACNLALKKADFILALGTRFGAQQVGKIRERYTEGLIVHVDIDAAELGRVFVNEIGIRSDLKAFLQMMLELKGRIGLKASDWNNTISEWREQFDSYVFVNNGHNDPVKFVSYISGIAPDNTIYTNDVGQNEMWVCQGLKLKKGQRLLSSSGYGSMGFSLPAGIGASAFQTGGCVISFMGDGGLQMNIQELQYISIHRPNIKCVVFNNNTLGMMRDVQRLHYKDHFLGSDTDLFRTPNLKKIAAAYSIGYSMIDSESDYTKLGSVVKSNEPHIIDCRLSIDSKVANWTHFLKEYPEFDI